MAKSIMILPFLMVLCR